MVYCGQCKQKFDTPALELEHICPVTGVRPTEPESMGHNWFAISKSALARGEKVSNKTKTEKEIKRIEAVFKKSIKREV